MPMKTLLKKTCLSVICLLAATNTMAYDFEYDGCYFDILIETPKKECEITYKKQYEETETYIGNFVIPDHVYYKNECYMVTSIGEEAFRGCSRLTSVYIPPRKTYNSFLLIENKGLTKNVSLTGNDLETSELLYSAMFCINQKNAFLICKSSVFLLHCQSYSSEKWRKSNILSLLYICCTSC